MTSLNAYQIIVVFNEVVCEKPDKLRLEDAIHGSWLNGPDQYTVQLKVLDETFQRRIVQLRLRGVDYLQFQKSKVILYKILNDT